MTKELYLFNTISRKKDLIDIPKTRDLSLYTCGPTVYHYAHIGNYRTYVVEDLLKRALLFLGWRVLHVMNITDVDDKTIKGAIRENKSLEAYIAPYTKAFFDDLEILRILKADHYPAATDHIKEMTAMIEELIKKEYAYIGGDGSVYFSINKYKEYGSLSHLKLSELKSNASNRLDLDEYDKDSASDFVLWKAYDENRDGKIYWESPFGKGRPGWHIECSAMAMKYLGENIDIHMGGVDNIFPHHENEIAQSECCSGKVFVNYWVHCEHLLVDRAKMSKSLGNFYTLKELLEKGYNGREIRLMLLQTHYRTQLNFTFEGLEAVRHTLRRIDDFVERLERITEDKSSDAFEGILTKCRQAFRRALLDDLNISLAMAALFDFIREINVLCDEGKLSAKDAQTIFTFFKELDTVLAILTPEKKRASTQRSFGSVKREKFGS